MGKIEKTVEQLWKNTVFGQKLQFQFRFGSCNSASTFSSFSSSKHHKIFLPYGMIRHLPCGTAVLPNYVQLNLHRLLPFSCFLSLKLFLFSCTLVCTLPGLHLDAYPRPRYFISYSHFRNHSSLHHSQLLVCCLAWYTVAEYQSS